jgi:hypothetical protein
MDAKAGAISSGPRISGKSSSTTARPFRAGAHRSKIHFCALRAPLAGKGPRFQPKKSRASSFLGRGLSLILLFDLSNFGSVPQRPTVRIGSRLIMRFHSSAVEFVPCECSVASL